MRLLKNSWLTFIILFCVVSHTTNAQSLPPRFEVGAHGSMFVYHGDLTTYKFGSRKTSKFGFGVYGSYRFNNFLSVRANFAKGKLEGDDEEYANPLHARKFNFNSPVTEFAGLLVWDVLGMGSKEISPNLFPYIIGGIGYSSLDIQRDYSENTYGANHPYTLGLEEDIPQTLPSQLIVPMVGIGIRHYLTPKLTVNAEFMHRFTSTDYLDGFSQAADPSNNDSYYTFSAGLAYMFGERGGKGGGPNFKKGKGRKGKIECPVYE
ncbi:DUF6089 family protein [Pontibacter locisalis]|uniref:DUF6089 family protein n=1 Tax=Pontibacter locisalis TaxID=1719035 RepID=A0ABW5IKS9_9BACT